MNSYENEEVLEAFKDWLNDPDADVETIEKYLERVATELYALRKAIKALGG